MYFVFILLLFMNFYVLGNRYIKVDCFCFYGDGYKYYNGWKNLGIYKF